MMNIKIYQKINLINNSDLKNIKKMYKKYLIDNKYPIQENEYYSDTAISNYNIFEDNNEHNSGDDDNKKKDRNLKVNVKSKNKSFDKKK